MAKTFHFEVVTPTRVFYSDDVEMVIFNREDGEMSVMADHMPMLVSVNVGVLRIKKDNEFKIAATGEGFLEIAANKVTAIVDSAEWPDEIDVERAVHAKELAEAKLKDLRKDKEMEVLLKASIQRAKNRINIANGSQK